MRKVKVIAAKGPKGGAVRIPVTARLSLLTETGRMVNLSPDRARRYLAKGVGTRALFNGKAVTFEWIGETLFSTLSIGH